MRLGQYQEANTIVKTWVPGLSRGHSLRFALLSSNAVVIKLTIASDFDLRLDQDYTNACMFLFFHHVR